MTCTPWEADFDCCSEWDDYTAPLQQRAETLAWATLKVLSGFRVGNCPVTVRPCLSEPCNICRDWGAWADHYWVRAGIKAGDWINHPCGKRSECSCTQLCEIVLPGPVAVLAAVTLDGVELPLADFRVDNGNRVVRTDGECWPSCQDLNKDVGEPGTLGITYVPGIVPDEAGLWAAGVLACEYAKACSGSACRLPAAVTSVARQGVTFTMSSGMFDSGQTGIREVDAYLISVNPNGLTIPPMVWSPDVPWARHRYTTTTAIVTP